jgi:hypothetical protein
MNDKEAYEDEKGSVLEVFLFPRKNNVIYINDTKVEYRQNITEELAQLLHKDSLESV